MNTRIFFSSLVVLASLVMVGCGKPSLSKISGTNATTTQVASTSYSVQDVARHNTEADCWIIIHNKAYDVTSYIPRHPGGVEQILQLCGKDATGAFDDRPGKGTPHPSNAQRMLERLRVGDIKN